MILYLLPGQTDSDPPPEERVGAGAFTVWAYYLVALWGWLGALNYIST